MFVFDSTTRNLRGKLIDSYFDEFLSPLTELNSEIVTYNL